MKISAIRLIFAPCLSWRSKDAPKGWHGESLKPGRPRTIYLDPRTPCPGKILLHELLHMRHPRWSEKIVRGVTHRLWKKFGWKDKADLLRLLGRGRIQGRRGK